ncbi:hypothetical protein [Solitalea lacus]|uniref:hypothetical protein n=1 Tax=Solitalea lacus TaxID=2911172 RepID=UPI001EDADA0C|nr:hypothetical protein [Solitalea lacus]UKJ06749.1 hypothetical protein L2B55_14570 [Solitalea lacus]
MEKSITTDNLIEFTPEILNQFKQKGYKTIAVTVIESNEDMTYLEYIRTYGEMIAFLLMPSFDEYVDKFTDFDNLPYPVVYPINSAIIEKRANGCSGVIVYVEADS